MVAGAPFTSLGQQMVSVTRCPRRFSGSWLAKGRFSNWLQAALLLALCGLVSQAALGAAESAGSLCCEWGAQGKPFYQVLSERQTTMGRLYYLSVARHPVELASGIIPVATTPSPAPVTSTTPTLQASATPRIHFFLRLGGDVVVGPFFELGPGISGLWGVQNLLGEFLFTGNAEFLLNKLFAGLVEDLLGISPAQLALSPLGQAVGAGTQFRFFTEHSDVRGAHGFGIGFGATGLLTENDLGAQVAILGHACVSASWPFVELNLYYKVPIWASSKALTQKIDSGTVGISFGLRDPLSPLAELVRALSE